MISRMKKSIKKILPNFLIKIIQLSQRKSQIRKMWKNDYNKFNKSAFKIVKTKNKENLIAEITFHYHSLEKGLSNINFREGFGKRAYTNLIFSLTEYKNKGYDQNVVAYQAGLSVINEYILRHKNTNIDTVQLKETLSELKYGEIKEIGGVYELRADDVIKASKSDFRDLAHNRFSVRDYSDRDVSIEKIESALEIASKTPSVCNRQPWHNYVVRKKDLIDTLLKIQGGFTGHGNNINTLIVVTSNNFYLSDHTERNQGFIDGGMYSMNLIYALQYEGLATCALNADLSLNNEKKICKLLNIPINQNIILFIAVGNYRDDFKVPKSPRDNYKEKTTFFNDL